MSADARPRANTSFELGEAAVHLDELLRQVGAVWVVEAGGKGVCDVSFGLSLGHIVEHLNRAWHYRSKSPEQVQGESQDEFILQAVTIPRLTPSLRMLAAADVARKEGDVVPASLPRWYLPWTWRAQAAGNPVLVAELAKARCALLDLRSGLDAAGLEDRTLADGLTLVLGHLNLAWHWRRKSATYVAALEASTREALANSIPWHAGTWSLRLEAPKPPAKA